MWAGDIRTQANLGNTRLPIVQLVYVLYISELKQGTNRSLVSFTSLVISSDNVNRGLVLFTMSASFTSLVTIKSLVCKLILINRSPPPPPSNRVNTVFLLFFALEIIFDVCFLF